MASCKQIESMLQARIDGELGHAQSVIVEQHLAECRACSEVLRQQQRTSAVVFEAFTPYRLNHSLLQGVMENLPEMEPLRIDMEGVNWREKAPVVRRSWWAVWAPAVAVAIMLCLAVPLYFAWPRTSAPTGDIIGVVTQKTGSVTCRGSEDSSESLAAVRNLISCSNRYVTGPGATLLLTLRGPTHLKVGENTRLLVCDDRELTVEAGHVLLDVAKEQRQFRVNTPSGTITVFGTVFDVLVNEDKTLVTLKAGKLQLENETATSFLHPGEQVAMSDGQDLSVPRKVDAASLTQWADAIVPDQEAINLFAAKIERQAPAELPAEEVFAVITTKDGIARPISSFYLTWNPDAAAASGHCSYVVHVYNQTMTELFKERIDASVFEDKDRQTYEIAVPGQPIRNTEVIHIKLAPDFSTGDVKTSFTKVWALGI